ncbi:porin [Cupriavidus sp. USMAA2-4]|uniref:Porin n=1 Tax=Cupriavidus malaysiensis TaxID=367825 RepID=A0ABN4TYW2_9BURK|nr:porin [Cupriavidus sp. USMAA2-4]AOZ04187.1 porin [Cupriavidus sp. USMAHM13]AOZ10733.1 porin [Cupriavidus malaysiensis]
MCRSVSLVPLGLSLLAALPSAHAQSAVVIYGRLNTALEYVSASTASDGSKLGDAARLSNYRSVFGLRGEEALGYGLKAVWQIESTLSIDTGAGQIAARDTRLGLDSPYGMVFMGNWDTPYTASTKTYDPYYPTTAGYMALLGNGAAATTDNVQNTSSFDRRQKNILQYQSPSWGGFSANLGYGLPEEKLTVPRNPALYSMAAAYNRGGLNVALAYEIHQHYQAAGRNDDAIKFGVSYQFAATRLSALYEHLHYRTASGDLERNGAYASLVQQVGTGSIRAGVGWVGNGTGSATETIGFFRSGPGTGALQFTVGYDYPLSKRTALYGYYSRINNRSNAVYDFAINPAGVKAGADPQVFALGMRHNF